MPVSVPVIRVVEKVIVSRPFKVLCEAENGTLPITYTLLKARMSVDERRVVDSTDKALFTINISHPDEINSFTCQAHNQGPSIRSQKTSQALTAEVIGKRTTHLHAEAFVCLIVLLPFLNNLEAYVAIFRCSYLP